MSELATTPCPHPSGTPRGLGRRRDARAARRLGGRSGYPPDPEGGQGLATIIAADGREADLQAILAERFGLSLRKPAPPPSTASAVWSGRRPASGSRSRRSGTACANGRRRFGRGGRHRSERRARPGAGFGAECPRPARQGRVDRSASPRLRAGAGGGHQHCSYRRAALAARRGTDLRHTPSPAASRAVSGGGSSTRRPSSATRSCEALAPVRQDGPWPPHRASCRGDERSVTSKFSGTANPTTPVGRDKRRGMLRGCRSPFRSEALPTPVGPSITRRTRRASSMRL